MKKSVAFILILLLCSTFIIGCGSTEGNQDLPLPDSGSSGVGNADVEKFDENAKGYVGSYANSLLKSTGKYIIANNKTDYKIVYPKDAGNAIKTAISEINLFVGEATGIEFDAMTDDSVSYTTTSKLISIGQTKLLKEAGITIRSDLGTCGTQIITKGASIFAFGNNERASLYAAYDFLGYILDFDYIFRDCYNLDRNVSQIELKEYNEVNIPDIEQRSSGYGWTNSDMLMSYRMRLTHKEDGFLTVNSKSGHNSREYIKNSVAGHESYWLGTDGNQLCYTARGNKQEYEAMQNACLETLKENLKRDRTSHIVTFTQEDVGTWCSCNACTALANQYGGKNSALLILFMNDLRAKLDAWFATEEGKEYYRDIELLFFAYHKTTEAPAVYDSSTGKYVGINGIHCNKGVSVWYAPIDADYTHSLFHEKNSVYLSSIYGWQAVSNKIYLWVYSTFFYNYLCLHNSFDGMQDTYKLAKKVNAVYIMDQAQDVTDYLYSWGTLKSYLNAKLAWNVNADVEELTRRFFTNYFGPVANEMHNYYLKQRLYLSWLSDNTNYSTKKSHSVVNIADIEEYWKKPVLEEWLKEINSIIDKISYLKRSDAELYDMYYKRIALERLSVYYLLVNLYSYNTSADLIHEYKLNFKNDAKLIGCEVIDELSKTVDEVCEEWGI